MKQKFWFASFFALLLVLSSGFLFIDSVSSNEVHQHVGGNDEAVGGNATEIEALQDLISERKKKIAQLEKTIGEFKQKIESKRLEAVSLTNQITILDTHISEIDVDIDVTEEKLQVLQLEIQSSELSITQKEQQIEKQKGILAELVRTIHEQDGKNYVEIAATHQSFSDFYDQLHYTRTVEEDLGKTTRGLRLIKEEIEDKKTELELQRAEHLALSEELKEKKKDLEEQSFAKQTLLANAESSERTYKTLVSGLKSQYQQIEGEITGYEREVRKRLEAKNKINQNTTDSVAAGKLSWPTPSHYVTAHFHDPTYPFRNVFEHSGTDIRAPHGTPLRAAASGYVARAKRCTLASCYSYVLLVHDGGISTLYGHMSKITVAEDQFVTRGDVIGYSGGTPGTVGAGPFVTGAHLHFEVRKDGIPVNPLSYLE